MKEERQEEEVFIAESYVVNGLSELKDGLTTVLHMKNVSNRKLVMVTDIRYQVSSIDGTRIYPNAEHFFVVGLNRSYESGGEIATPINLDRTSRNVATVACYTDSPEVTGEALEVSRIYTDVFGKPERLDEAIILGEMDTIELAYHGRVTGFVSARIQFETFNA